MAEKHHLLYTTGYVPALSAYPGMRVPMPIEIIEHHGHFPIDVVCQEILALTKINWNSCNFSCREPITIQFARSVGKIVAVELCIEPDNRLADLILFLHAHRDSFASVQHRSMIPAPKGFSNFMQGGFGVAGAPITVQEQEYQALRGQLISRFLIFDTRVKNLRLCKSPAKA